MVKKIKGIVRIGTTDMDENIETLKGLRKIKGISHRMARALCFQADVNPSAPIGDLEVSDLEKLEELMTSEKIPDFMKNRRDEDKHLLSGEIDLKIRQDVNKLQKMRAYKGIRHEQGLPVRGQKTKSSFRGNKTVGVSRAKAKKKAKAEKKE